MDTVESANMWFYSFNEHLMRTYCVISSFFFLGAVVMNIFYPPEAYSMVEIIDT